MIRTKKRCCIIKNTLGVLHSDECAEPHCKIEMLSRKDDFLEHSRWLSSVSHIDENVRNENRFKSNNRAFTTHFKILFRRIYPVKTRHAVNSQDKRTIKISRWKRRGINCRNFASLIYNKNNILCSIARERERESWDMYNFIVVKLYKVIKIKSGNYQIHFTIKCILLRVEF